MFKGFMEASDEDIRTRRGVVYVIEFEDGYWYCGSTWQSFYKRYGTASIGRSCLIPSKKVRRHLATGKQYKIWLSSKKFSSEDDLRNEEFRLIASRITKDRKCLNQRTSDENFATRRASFKLRDPNGSVYEFNSVKDAKKTIGATSHTQVSAVLAGRFRSVCGWTLPETKGPTGRECYLKPCELVDPNGNVVSFKSINHAIEVVGTISVRGLLNGKSTTARGWKLKNAPKRKYIPVKLVSPSGRKHTFPSRKAAADHIGCCNQLVSMLCLGKASAAKGWTLDGEQEVRHGR